MKYQIFSAHSSSTLSKEINSFVSNLPSGTKHEVGPLVVAPTNIIIVYSVMIKYWIE